jgi:hypothetical protein
MENNNKKYDIIKEGELPIYEYMNYKAFEDILIDVIMKKDNITENKAIKIMKNLKINSSDCVFDDNTGASIRKGTVETLKKLGYNVECLIEERSCYLQPILKNNNC